MSRSPQQPAGAQPRISLCLIVRNEEANLADCVRPVRDLVDELIVVDTGSTDGTRAVAQQLGARLFEFTWVDSFAAARNECLRHATGKWIFWLDADDRVDEVNRDRLRTLFAGLAEPGGYMMRVLCPDAPGSEVSAFDHCRLFPHLPGLRWTYRVHEQIVPALQERKVPLHFTDVMLVHHGYLDPALRERKYARNLELLLREHAENPNDSFTLFNLGWAYQEARRLPEAYGAYRRCLTMRPQLSFLPKLYGMLCRVARHLGRLAEALAVCREGRTLFPEDAPLSFEEGAILYAQGDLHGAEVALLRVLNAPPPKQRTFAFAEQPGLRGALTRSNLAVVYRDQRRPADAESQWRAAVAENPDALDAWLGLGELYLEQRRWSDIEPILTVLDARPQAQLQADMLRAQYHQYRREYTAARQVLARSIERMPQHLSPRLVLSRVLWEEGSDRAALERALRDVLAIAPNNAEARGRLEQLQPQASYHFTLHP